jgi:peptidoglycan/LPS O-acetylase OafA/YrhL
MILAAAFGMQFFWGVLLADLQNNDAANSFLAERLRSCRILSLLFISLGLLMASFPEGHAEWMTWSRVELAVLQPILPENPDFPRFASGIGLELVTLGLHFGPWVREHLLSSRYLLWLGKQSFAVYLLHGPLLRWILVWMLYGVNLPADGLDDKGELVAGPALPFPGRGRYIVALTFWIPLSYGVAVLWTTYVDPWCARMTELLVGRVLLRRDEKRVVLPS